MTRAKGSTVAFVRNTVRQRGEEAEKTMLALLQPHEREVYETALPIAWYEMSVVNRICEAAARALYPSDPDRMRRIGADNARHDLTGIYRVFLRVASINFVIDQVARMWRTYHNAGAAHVERDEDRKKGTLVIEEYPTLPPSFQEVVSGFVIGGLELAGARNVKVVRDTSNPHAWKWITTWD